MIIQFLSYECDAFAFSVFTIIYSFAGLYYSYENRLYDYYAYMDNLDKQDNQNIKIEEIQNKNTIRSYSINYLDKENKLIEKN